MFSVAGFQDWSLRVGGSEVRVEHSGFGGLWFNGKFGNEGSWAHGLDFRFGVVKLNLDLSVPASRSQGFGLIGLRECKTSCRSLTTYRT